MSQVMFNAKPRLDLGSKNAGRLRRSGRVPAVVYGRNSATRAIDLDNNEFVAGFRNISESTIIKLVIEGKSCEAIVKGFQHDIVSGRILHVDFYEVESDQLLRANVPLHFFGTPIGVREGGVLENPVHEIEVECLPRFLPERIDLDLSTLAANQAIHVRDLKLAPEIRLLTSDDQVIALVKFAKVEIEPVVEEAAEVEATAEPSATDSTDESETGKGK